MRKRTLVWMLLAAVICASMVLPVMAEDTDGASGSNTGDTQGTVCTAHTGAWTNAGESHTRTCTTCSAPETAPHSWGEGTITTNPTCTETGVKSYACTAGCGATKVESVAAAGHTYGSWVKVDGSTHKRTCTISGCTASETASHEWGTGQVTEAATCLVEGEKIYTCTCGFTKVEVIPLGNHSYSAWDADLETHSRTCSVCEKEDSGKHSWGTGTVIQETTCKDEGKTVFACSVCERVKEETYEKLTTHTYDNVCDTDCNVCGVTRETEHTFSKVWSKDATGHWHTCTGCGEKEDFSKHLAGPGATEEKAQTCVTCGLVLTPKLKHSHQFETKYSSNELGHWYACTGCEEEKGFEEHAVDGVCDTECDSCGYRFKTTHIFGGEWESDASGHWNQCTLCGEKSEIEDHIPFPGTKENEAKLCSECGFEISPAEEHSHISVDGWQYNDTNHWWDCSCGEKQEESAHQWDEGIAGKDDTVTYTCTVCQAERVIEAESKGGGSIVLLLLLIVLVIAFVATVVVLIFMLRGNKHSGKFSK